KTESGWKAYDDMEWGIGYNDENKSTMELDSEAPAGEGYYRVVLNLGGKKYTDYFRVENIPAVPWLDEYSLKNDSITVSFTVYNRNKKPIDIQQTYVTSLYKKENGEWKSMQEKAGLYDCIDVIPEYTTLEQYQKTDVSFKLSEYYDTAKLEAGDYAVSIGGVGFAEFRLTDKEQKASEFPFANLKSEDIKEIRLAFYLSYGKPWKMSIKDGDCLKRSVDCLRQFKLNGEVKDHTNYDGGMLEVVVRYKNNTKKTLSFQISNEVIFNGKTEYYCNGYAYSALYDMLIENIDADIEDYYG
ncbi:MAG: hypothetical protein K2H23_06740, partial [Oscillospiraceae bacterium]|nr:hypothetical protein [Oscillospiraceae bacterium]